MSKTIMEKADYVTVFQQTVTDNLHIGVNHVRLFLTELGVQGMLYPY